MVATGDYGGYTFSELQRELYAIRDLVRQRDGGALAEYHVGYGLQRLPGSQVGIKVWRDGEAGPKGVYYVQAVDFSEVFAKARAELAEGAGT